MSTFRHLRVSFGGWLSCFFDGVDGIEHLWVRVAECGTGRLVITDLILHDASLITVEVLREIPLSKVEAAANEPAVFDQIIERLNGSAPDRSCNLPVASAMEIEKARVRLLRLLGESVTAAALTASPPRLKIDVPEGGRKPDWFYLEIARVYGYLTRTSQRPAVKLAEANGVPVTTAHRWVREGRRRGLVSSARRQLDA